MKASELIVGQQYAYQRTKHGIPRRVNVIATGDFGGFGRSDSHRRIGFEAVRRAAGLKDDVRVRVADEKGTVVIAPFGRSESSADYAVEVVSARYITKTWDQQVADDEEKRVRNQQAKQRAEEAAQHRANQGAVFHDEVAEFLRAAQALGIIDRFVDNGFGSNGVYDIAASGVTVDNYSGDGHWGRHQQVVLSREVLRGIAKVLSEVSASVSVGSSA